jgi:transposase
MYDYEYLNSRYLVDNYDFISFEDLDIKALVQDSNLAKLILDAGWGTLITFVTYKAVMDRDYNVSVNILQKGLARGEGSGGVSSKERISQPSPIRESHCL